MQFICSNYFKWNLLENEKKLNHIEFHAELNQPSIVMEFRTPSQFHMRFPYAMNFYHLRKIFIMF